MQTDTRVFQYFRILVLIAIILIIGYIFWVSLQDFFTEGNPILYIGEVNESIASSGDISYLSDQEYLTFPRLQEVLENQEANLSWNDGYRDSSRIKISEQQKNFILSHYHSYLEYKGKYYHWVIATP
jgi:hypothetical protein